MSLNSYLNLRFVNVLHSLLPTKLCAAEIFSAAQGRQTEALAYTGRLFMQEHVDNYEKLNEYLISNRDVNAWKLGVFKFFYSYYKLGTEGLIKDLSLRHDSDNMEKIIDSLHFDDALNDFYQECGHDPYFATKYSVSKIICDEKRINWMNTFCAKFAPMLDIAYDTGIITKDLVNQLDLVESAFGLGIISQNERNELLEKCGGRIVKMYGSWGKFIASYLLACIYDICLSSAEVRYLPRAAQQLLDITYLVCYNDIQKFLLLPGWDEARDEASLKELQEALRPLVNAPKLDHIWQNQDSKNLGRVELLTKSFLFYKQYFLPLIHRFEVEEYFQEYSKVDEFIPISSGSDFRIYFEAIHLPLKAGELPFFIMKYAMFTTRGVWSFGPYMETNFKEWPDSISFEESLPIHSDYGKLILPFFIPEMDCDLNIRIPTSYNCQKDFMKKNPFEQLIALGKDVSGLKSVFMSIPKVIKQARKDGMIVEPSEYSSDIYN